MKNVLKVKAIKYSLVVSIIYVGVGTLSLFALYSSFSLTGNLALLGVLITMPVTFIGFAIIYTVTNYLPLLILT